MEEYKRGQEKAAADASISTAPQNFERAREERAAWPEWKQEHTLTKHSGAVQFAHPAVFEASGTVTGRVSAGQPTMSSREIAELVEVRHDNVKRTIQMLAGRGVITLPQFEEVSNTGPGPKIIGSYRLGKRDSFVVVAQLSPEFTGRVVDRWQELEEQVAKPAPSQALVVPSSDPLDLLLAQAQMFPKLITELQEQKRAQAAQAQAIEAQAEKLQELKVVTWKRQKV